MVDKFKMKQSWEIALHFNKKKYCLSCSLTKILWIGSNGLIFLYEVVLFQVSSKVWVLRAFALNVELCPWKFCAKFPYTTRLPRRGPSKIFEKPSNISSTPLQNLSITSSPGQPSQHDITSFSSLVTVSTCLTLNLFNNALFRWASAGSRSLHGIHLAGVERSNSCQCTRLLRNKHYFCWW